MGTSMASGFVRWVLLGFYSVLHATNSALRFQAWMSNLISWG